MISAYTIIVVYMDTVNTNIVAIMDAVNTIIITYHRVWVVNMGITKLTIEKYIGERNITRYQLSQGTGIRYETINRYYRNRVVRYDGFILAKICEYLNCGIGDILEYVKQ